MKLIKELIDAAERTRNGRFGDMKNTSGNLIKKNGYYEKVDFNVFRLENKDMEAFKKSGGQELDWKACAVYSSSMLAYNFFSWIDVHHPCLIDGVEYNTRYFEVRIPCLKTSRANMDITLLSKDKTHALFIESKFTEHFANSSSKMKKISNAYIDSEKYYENGDFWKHVIKIEKDNAKQGRAYHDGIKQEICHLIAIENIARGNEIALQAFDNLNRNCHSDLVEAIRSIRQFHFTSLVFAPSPRYEQEYKAYQNYNSIHKSFRDLLATSNSTLNLKIKYLTYSDLWDIFKESMDSKRAKYLQSRYMSFSVDKP